MNTASQLRLAKGRCDLAIAKVYIARTHSAEAPSNARLLDTVLKLEAEYLDSYTRLLEVMKSVL